MGLLGPGALELGVVGPGGLGGGRVVQLDGRSRRRKAVGIGIGIGIGIGGTCVNHCVALCRK